jgi:hypothetical protein
MQSGAAPPQQYRCSEDADQQEYERDDEDHPQPTIDRDAAYDRKEDQQNDKYPQ